MTETLLPFAITVGCSPQEFWYEDPNLLWAYKQAYVQKLETDQKTSMQRIYNSAWMTGAYVRIAIVSALGGNVKYPPEPQKIDAPEITEEDIAKARDTNIKIRAIQIQAMLNRGITAVVPRKNMPMKG